MANKFFSKCGLVRTVTGQTFTKSIQAKSPKFLLTKKKISSGALFQEKT